jgi:hypothetical protein
MRMTFSNVSISTWVVLGLAVLAIVVALGCRRRTGNEGSQPLASQTRSNHYPHFVFAKVMDPVMPLVRGEKYEDPLSASLEARKLGEIAGGGTQLDKNNQIEWVGIDIQLADLEGAVEFVRQRLRELGAPAGSVLEFKRGDEEVTLPIHSAGSVTNK